MKVEEKIAQTNVSITVSGVIRVTPKDVDQSHTAFAAWREAGLPDPEGTILTKLATESGRYKNVEWYAHVAEYKGIGNRVGELGRNETTVISWSGTQGAALAALPDPTNLIEGKNLVPLGAQESNAVFQSALSQSSSVIKMAVVTSEAATKLPEAGQNIQTADFSIFQEKS